MEKEMEALKTAKAICWKVITVKTLKVNHISFNKWANHN